MLGAKLEKALFLDVSDAYETKLRAEKGSGFDEYRDSLPHFRSKYESWYSESRALIKQVLPDRLQDFIQHYEPARSRKELDVGNYRIRDYLQGLSIRSQGVRTVSGKDAIAHFQQQFAIVMAARERFESSLYEIRQIVQADLMDSEIDAAEHLAKYKYTRAAGALAGVVLERHLSQVCMDHEIVVPMKNPTINNFNELLKAAGIIEVPDWRFIQLLADIRNNCDHNKTPEPTPEQVGDLIAGVKKVMKTVF